MGRDSDGALGALLERVGDESLSHYGVPGMRWGYRKGKASGGRKKGDDPEDVTVKTRPGGRVSTSGGRNQPASDDAISVAVTRRIARASSVSAVNSSDLQAAINRMQMEKKFADLERSKHPLENFVKGLVANTAKTEVTALARGEQGKLTQQVSKAMGNKKAKHRK